MAAVSEALFSSALLVEDERSLATALRIALRKLGIPTAHAPTLGQASRLAESSPPDFILLDRNLPDGDGIELCARLRKSGYHGSILMLTAAGQTSDRVEGLNSGADDYLSKPFSWAELEARIRALARRKQSAAAHATEPASDTPAWELDSARLRVRKPGPGPETWVTLTPLEFKLVEKLISSEGAIISREELLKEVWGFTLLPRTRTVDHFLGRLRKHFETNPEEPRHFITIRGAGYRFEK